MKRMTNIAKLTRQQVIINQMFSSLSSTTIIDIASLHLYLLILGTGFWHFKVEYKENSNGEDGDCKVTRIGGLS